MLFEESRSLTLSFVRIIGRQKTYVGGATLIAPNKVLTVAHKFYRTYASRFIFLLCYIYFFKKWGRI